MTQNLVTGLKAHWPLWLALLAVMLQPFGRSVELVVLAMSVVGLYDILKNRDGLRQTPAFKVFTLIFCCFWIPTLFSLPDAVNLSKSVVSTTGMLRFYFAGLFVLSRLNNPQYIRWFAAGVAFTVLFWGGDGLLQALTGQDLFGREMIGSRVTGIFGDKLRTGWMLVPLAFCAILYFVSVKKYWLVGLCVIVALGTIITSGDRGAWVGAFWATILLVLMVFQSESRPSKKVSILIVAILAISVTAAIQDPQVKSRIDYTKGALHGDYAAWDKATSYRLTLWQTAIDMIGDNWLNGVGVRGFRYAYPSYAPKDDKFLHGEGEGDQLGAFHAHQIILEVLAEAGLLGLLGYLIAVAIFVWLMRETIRRKGFLALGYLASVAGVLMPLNSHLSFYSSYWAQACWILFAITVATVFYEREEVT